MKPGRIIQEGHAGRRTYVNRRRRQIIFRRTSFVSAILISTLLLIGASRMVSHAQDNNELHYYKYYTSITVMPGDTLSSIAAAHSDNYGSIDEQVSEILSINHMADDMIYPGTSLIIPYYSIEYKN